MPLYQLLTDRTLAEASAITPTTLIHIVTTADTRQNSAGSSYKAELGQLVGLFSGGSVSGEYLPLSGGTVTGSTSFTNGLTANTISATTYQNLPISGTHNYLSKFSSGSTILVDSQLRDDGSTVGLGLPPNTNGKFYVLTSTEPYAIATENQTTNGIGVYGQAFALGNTTGVVGVANGTSTSNIGVYGQANEATTNIGLKGYAFNGTNNYSIQLLDGTEGIGKVLTSVTSDGKANWQILPSFTGNTSATCINEFYVSDIYGCTGTTFHNQVCFETIPTGTTGYTLSVNENGCLLIATGTTSKDIISDNVVVSDSFSGPRGNFSDYVRVSKIKSFSPLLINYGDEGDVYFGSTSGVTIDVLNSRIGIGTNIPSEKLDVSGKTKTINFQMTSGATNGYVLTSDAGGNATWQLPTGGGTFTGGTVSGSTEFTNGLTANTISATTYQNLPDNVTGNYLPLSGGTVSGNTTITANLTVSGNSGVNWFSSNTSSDLVRITQTGVGNAFVVEDNTNPDSTPFIINSGGSVSIGTTSVFSVGGGAETKLNVSTGSSGVATTGLSVSTPVIVESAVGTSVGLLNPDVANSQIYFGTPSDPFGSYLRWDYTNRNLILATANSTGKLIFQTANAVEVARIDQSGNMGIGLTGATQKLEVSGNTRIYGTLSADTISATTYQNLPTDVRVTGGTYSAGTITFTNNTGGTFNVTGLTTGSTSTISGDYLPLSGGTVTGTTTFTNGLTANTISATTIGTSGDCITDLYVSNIHSCSPLNINPLDEGNVYFGSTSGVTVDVINSRLGIGTNNPQYPIEVNSNNSQLFYNPTSAGGLLLVSGQTSIPRMGVIIPPYLTNPSAAVTLGLRAWDDMIFTNYGNVGDTFLRATDESNGLNLINSPGVGTQDYIRFYAGNQATATPDIHIQGSGATRGYVGIGTESPSEILDVNGKTKTINFQMTSGATNGYVLTSDASGNASWQASTGGGDYLPLSGGTVSGTTTFTNGLTANTISATTIGNSGDCVDDLYVTKIHSCSPLNINPLNEGNVYFGSTSGVSIDLSNTRFGIGTSTPQFPFQIVGANSTFYYDPTSVGGRFNVSGNTNIPRYDVSIGAYLTRPATGGSVGLRSWNDVSYPGYGKVGDMHIYAGNETYGLNIINGPGTNTEDYIRFYAGTDATSTSDIHIQGTGTTRGFVGLGIENPTAKLHVFGSTIVTGTLTATTVSATTSTITTSTSNNLIVSNPYVPTGSTDPTGVVGTISWSGNSIYLRNSTEWVRFTGETSW